MISAARLLEAWDRGQAAASVPARALALLSLADPEADPASLPVGEVNARLLELRGRLFGPQLTCVGNCPGCGEPLELSFSVSDFLTSAVAPPSEVEISVGDESLRFRLPTWVDLAAIATASGRTDPRDTLLQRCLLGAEVERERFSAPVQESVATAIEEADPLAEMLIEIGCAQCDSQFEARFDIVEYLWADVEVRSRRLLGEVHALASAYGWREAEVLALSPARRRVYLEMAVGK